MSMDLELKRTDFPSFSFLHITSLCTHVLPAAPCLLNDVLMWGARSLVIKSTSSSEAIPVIDHIVAPTLLHAYLVSLGDKEVQNTSSQQIIRRFIIL